jgi:hypothetical protein
MENFYLDGVKLPVVKSKRPRFSTHRGRTWDTGNVRINGVEYKVHLDTTWGEYIYFQYGNENTWFKVKMISDTISDLKGNKWDIDPFSHRKSDIVAV